MKNKKVTTKPRNWFLVFIASILIVLGAALVALSIVNVASFGGWSVLMGLGGLMTIAAAVLSIVKNDPSWILLDLIIPG